MDTLYDRELEQLRTALAETRPAYFAGVPAGHGSSDPDSDPDSDLVQDVAAWVERACASLPEGHPLRLRRDASEPVDAGVCGRHHDYGSEACCS